MQSHLGTYFETVRYENEEGRGEVCVHVAEYTICSLVVCCVRSSWIQPRRLCM
jgi:hypothetical protein